MGRKGGFGSSRNTSRPSARQSTPATAPRPAQPQAQSQSGGMLSGFMGTMMQGMAFGAGSEVAHQGVRSLMGGNSHSQVQEQAQPQQVQNQMTTGSCQMENTNFVECLKFNSNNIANCQDYLSALKSCEQQFK